MKLRSLHIKNYRSIKDSGEFPLTDLFALVGENNSGKSNVLRAVDILTSAGAGGVRVDDFNDPALPVIIKGVFDALDPFEKIRWRPYLINEKLTIEKHIQISDATPGKVSTEFHGYQSEPKDWFLSIRKINEREGVKPKWLVIAQQNNLPDYFYPDGKCNKTTYEKGLNRYLLENTVEYDDPDLSTTQALGLASNVIACFPQVYVLEAITDYSDEIDKRSSSTTFRKLMGDLSERILKKDPRYSEILQSLEKIHGLLNTTSSGVERLTSLSTIEGKITSMLQKLMPSVASVNMSIKVDEMKDIFTAGVSLNVDDGSQTDVLSKGHGLQRCIVFTLLQALIMNNRNQMVPVETEHPQNYSRSIILCIEEPELYIHPQLCKLFYDVMKSFTTTDQVFYSTHSTWFVDAYEPENIGLVKKESVSTGTLVKTCDRSAFDGFTERKIFQTLTRLNPSINEIFFSKRVLLVEGPEDLIAVTAVLMKAGKISNRVEELDWTITVAGGKQAIPFLQRVLNSFEIEYAVLHDLDADPTLTDSQLDEHKKTNDMISSLASSRAVYNFPIKLENTLGLAKGHLKDQYDAHKYFEDPTRISSDLELIILPIFSHN